MMSKFLLGVFLLVLVSCSALPALEDKDDVNNKKYNDIVEALMGLAPNIDITEAREVANIAVYYTYELAKQYRLMKPPSFHNILVNSRLKPRGLCFHWANDLQNRFHALNMRSFDIYWGIANVGKKYDEHSNVVLTAKNHDFNTGVLFDGWRDSGNLYWNYVMKDPKYKWFMYRKIN